MNGHKNIAKNLTPTSKVLAAHAGHPGLSFKHVGHAATVRVDVLWAGSSLIIPSRICKLSRRQECKHARLTPSSIHHAATWERRKSVVRKRVFPGGRLENKERILLICHFASKLRTTRIVTHSYCFHMQYRASGPQSDFHLKLSFGKSNRSSFRFKSFSSWDHFSTIFGSKINEFIIVLVYTLVLFLA